MPSKATPAPVATPAPYTAQTLTLRSIHVLDDIQPRFQLDERVVEEYATLYREDREAESEDTLPPIDVYRIEGKHYVSDGFHRLEAAKSAKRKELACHVYDGSQQEAMRHGVFVNLRRGLAYSYTDRQRILERFLHDPEVSQRTDRAIARDLGLSHVTVGRARHRLQAEASLKEQWLALPVTQTKDDLRRQEQIATFLKVEPQLVARYEKINREPMDTGRVISWVARNMTDRNEPEANAKAAVTAHLEKEVREREQQHVWRQETRRPKPPKATPEERARMDALQARREEEWQRQHRDRHLCLSVQRFAELQGGIRSEVSGGPCTFADLLAALSPKSLQQMPELLSQAEAVLQALKDALGLTATV